MRKQIFTIPNLLSLVRLALIPVLLWLYIGQENYLWTAVVLALSGVTDLVDGFVARRFSMVSDLGKILDPIADKLTQIAMLGCLLTRFPYMLPTLILLVCKELFGGITGLLAIGRSGRVESADWHGKVTTTLLYAVMGLHLLLPNIPATLSYVLMGICTAMMLLSLVLYAIRNFKMIRT